jgi:hypothetical protein
MRRGTTMYDFEVYTLLTRQRMDRALDEARRDWLAHQVAGQSPSGWATLARFLARVMRMALFLRARSTPGVLVTLDKRPDADA